MTLLRDAIEHTLLAPDAIAADFERLVNEAVAHALFGVCVPSVRVREVRALLGAVGEGPRLVTVVGFPSGAVPTAIKARECSLAVDDGADELDMVINIGWIRDADFERVRREVADVVAAASGRPVKVILETGLLSDEQKRISACLCVDAGAAFVKTSTGTPERGGATVADIRLLRAAVGEHVGVKASGGVRSRAFALELLAAGANRIGTSAGPRLLTEGDLA